VVGRTWFCGTPSDESRMIGYLRGGPDCKNTADMVVIHTQCDILHNCHDINVQGYVPFEVVYIGKYVTLACRREPVTVQGTTR